jgi:hypothetical protein
LARGLQPFERQVTTPQLLLSTSGFNDKSPVILISSVLAENLSRIRAAAANDAPGLAGKYPFDQLLHSFEVHYPIRFPRFTTVG